MSVSLQTDCHGRSQWLWFLVLFWNDSPLVFLMIFHVLLYFVNHLSSVSFVLWLCVFPPVFSSTCVLLVIMPLCIYNSVSPLFSYTALPCVSCGSSFDISWFLDSFGFDLYSSGNLYSFTLSFWILAFLDFTSVDCVLSLHLPAGCVLCLYLGPHSCVFPALTVTLTTFS